MSRNVAAWFLFVLAIIPSCYRTQQTTLEVTVKDGSGELVEGASVHVYAEPTVSSGEAGELEADYYATTNSDGKVVIDLNNIFKPGQNGVAVLHVSVSKEEKNGNGNIELIQETANKIEIVIE